MIRPPSHPRDPPLIDQPTWRSILASYALAAAVPLLLWAISNPFLATASLGGVACLVVGGRRANDLRRCVHHCQTLSFQLGETARITVTQLPTDDTN